MSLVINTNSIATTATKNLGVNQANLQRSLARLSSGSKIVVPADDAGGLAVSNKLQAALNRNTRAQQNVQNALSFMQVQDGAFKVATSSLDRMSELKTMSLDPTKNSLDIANYDAEFTQLQEQLSNIKSEKFNGIDLFNQTSNLTVYTTERGDSNGEPTVTASRTGLFNDLGNITYGGSAPTVAEFTIDTAFTASTAAATTFVKTTATDGSIRLGYIANTAANVTAAGHGLDFDAAVASTDIVEINNVSSVYDYEAGVAKARVFEASLSTHAGGEVVFDDASNSFYLANGVAKNYSDSTAAAATVQANPGEFSKLSGYPKASDHSAYDASSSYQLGDIVSLNSNLYVASANISAGAGNPTTNAVAGTGWVALPQNAQSGADLLTSSNMLSNNTTNDFVTFIQTAAQNGAEMQRLNVSLEMLQTNHTNFEAAKSRLSDVDIATESTAFAKHNILTQSAAAMLSQANNLPSIALQLLQ